MTFQVGRLGHKITAKTTAHAKVRVICPFVAPPNVDSGVAPGAEIAAEQSLDTVVIVGVVDAQGSIAVVALDRSIAESRIALSGLGGTAAESGSVLIGSVGSAFESRANPRSSSPRRFNPLRAPIVCCKRRLGSDRAGRIRRRPRVVRSAAVVQLSRVRVDESLGVLLVIVGQLKVSEVRLLGHVVARVHSGTVG